MHLVHSTFLSPDDGKKVTLLGVSRKRCGDFAPIFSERSNCHMRQVALRFTRSISYIQVAFAGSKVIYLSLWSLGGSCIIVDAMMSRILAIVTVTSSCLLILLLTMTSPATVGLAGMLAVFLLGYLSLLGVVTFLLYYGSKLSLVVLKKFRKRDGLTLTKAYLYASVLSTLPMMLVGLYPTGGVEWYEVLLLILFGVMGVLYIARRTS